MVAEPYKEKSCFLNRVNKDMQNQVTGRRQWCKSRRFRYGMGKET
jgi:hypothetical protein